MSFVTTDEFSVGTQKLLQGLLTVYLSVFKFILIQGIMAILTKRCKPGNFE